MGVLWAPQDAVRAYFTVFGRVFVGGSGMLFGCRLFLENGYVRDSGDGYTSSPFSHEKAFAFFMGEFQPSPAADASASCGGRVIPAF